MIWSRFDNATAVDPRLRRPWLSGGPALACRLSILMHALAVMGHATVVQLTREVASHVTGVRWPMQLREQLLFVDRCV